MAVAGRGGREGEQIDGKDWGSLSRAATPAYSTELRRSNFTIGTLYNLLTPLEGDHTGHRRIPRK